MSDIRPEVRVRTKAVLVEPGSLSIVWANESAAEAMNLGGRSLDQVSIAEIIPFVGVQGVESAILEAGRTGEPNHLRADLISSARGSVATVTSVYRLPDGHVLVLTEQSYRLDGRKEGAVPPSSPRRRR